MSMLGSQIFNKLADMFFDRVNSFLGLGHNLPYTKLHVKNFERRTATAETERNPSVHYIDAAIRAEAHIEPAAAVSGTYYFPLSSWTYVDSATDPGKLSRSLIGGLNCQVINNNSGSIPELLGSNVVVKMYGGGNTSTIWGSEAGLLWDNAASTTMAACFYGRRQVKNGSSVANLIGLHLPAPEVTGVVTVSLEAGIYIDGGTTNAPIKAPIFSAMNAPCLFRGGAQFGKAFDGTHAPNALVASRANADQFRAEYDASHWCGLEVDANGVSLIKSSHNRLRWSNAARTPASSTAPGTVGEMCWDADYLYLCVATDTWKRTPLTAW